MTMNSKPNWEDIGEFLKSGVYSKKPTLPSEFLIEIDTNERCDVCGGPMDVVGTNDGEVLICQKNSQHEKPRETTTASYRLDVKYVFEEIANLLNYPANGFNDGRMSDYASLEPKTGLRFVIVSRPERYNQIANQLFSDSVRQQRVNVIFPPKDHEQEIWEQASSYPIGSLTPPIPIEMLSSSPEKAKSIISSAVDSMERSKDALSMQNIDEDPFTLLNQNPRMIQSELSYTQVQRELGMGSKLGERLEEITKAAFMAIDYPMIPDFGGKSGNNEIDIATKIPAPSRYGEKPILGLVDTKSSSEADISREGIVKKHMNYLKQANAPTFDNHHIAHMFVVFSLKGATANEIDWYDAIREAMNSESRYGSNTSMVVLFAEALSQIVDVHLSLAQRNLANLSIADVQDLFYPFFNYKMFESKIPANIQKMTRMDGENPNEHESKYAEEYLKREQLLVITPEMVNTYVRHVLEDDGYDFVQHELEAYPSKWF